MKHWEEIRYYAPKTTAASSTFIIGWIFIIKNFSSWVTAAEYSGPARATKMVSLCVCAVSVCLQMHVQIFAAIFFSSRIKEHARRFSLKSKKCLHTSATKACLFCAMHNPTPKFCNATEKRPNSWMWDDIKGKTAVKKTTKKMGLHPPLCTSCNHSTVNFKQQYQKGPLSKPPDFLSHLFSPPSHLSALIHFNYASSHFSWSLYSSAAPVLIVAAMIADMFCILKRVWERGRQINIQPRGFWKARLSLADGHHIIWGELLAEAVGGL